MAINPVKRRWLRLMVFPLALAAALVGLWMVRGRRPQERSAQPSRRVNLPPDPRQTYAGPWRNIRSEVHYVGSESCTSCHAKIAESFRRHPMGRSLAVVAKISSQERYDQASHNPFRVGGSEFLVERQGERVWHRQTRVDATGTPIFGDAAEVHFVVGSGRRGRSYITSKEGYLFQTAVSWFEQKRRWDLSPGFAADNLWGRPVLDVCLHCHANRAELRPGYVNHYKQPPFRGHAIGCERCHGPGEAHVSEPQRFQAVTDPAAWGLQAKVEKIDPTIVNPGKLDWRLREAVCQQCHLQGEARILRRGRDLYDYRPGLPVEVFWSIFVAARQTDHDPKAVSHVEQMYASGCFQRSPEERKLGCISCHDPHAQVDEGQRISHYRRRCLQCHAAGDRNEGDKVRCTEPLARRRRDKQDNCVACHMPPYPSADVAHTASTDHRIARRPAMPSRPRPDRAGMPIVPFQHGGVKVDDADSSRDLALAMVSWFSRHPEFRQHADKMLPLLDDAVINDPDDLPGWEAKAKALLFLERRTEGLEAAESILARVPTNEAALELAARFAQDLNTLEPALKYWRGAIDANPWMARYRANCTALLAFKGDWGEARSSCRKWLELEPASVEARKIWIACLVRGGEMKEARAEFARVEALAPPNLTFLRAWFAGLERGDAIQENKRKQR